MRLTFAWRDWGPVRRTYVMLAAWCTLLVGHPSVSVTQTVYVTAHGSFTHWRRVDDMTDEVIDQTAYSGEIPDRVRRLSAIMSGAAVPRYEGLEVRCYGDRPSVSVYFHPGRPAAPGRVEPVEFEIPVHLRIDAQPAWEPARWRVWDYQATMPDSVVPRFLSTAVVGGQVRIRLGELRGSETYPGVGRYRDLAFGLAGLSTVLRAQPCFTPWSPQEERQPTPGRVRGILAAFQRTLWLVLAAQLLVAAFVRHRALLAVSIGRALGVSVGVYMLGLAMLLFLDQPNRSYIAARGAIVGFLVLRLDRRRSANQEQSGTSGSGAEE